MLREAQNLDKVPSAGRNRALLPAFTISLVDFLGMTIIIPLLPFYAEKYGATPLVVGMLVSVFALCQLIGGPILGKLSDVFGRKPLLVISQLGTFVGFVILALAPNIWWVFLSRIIDGITAGNVSLVQAHISDTTEPEERAKSFGYLGMAFGIGFFIGPAISGYLSQYNYQYPIWVAAGLSLLSILFTFLFMPSKAKHLQEEHKKSSSKLLDLSVYGKYFREPLLAESLYQWLLYSLAFAVFTSGFALFAERQYSHLPEYHFGVRQVGYVLSYVGFLGIVLPATLTGRLVKKLGEHKTMQLSLLCLMIGYGMLAFTRGIVGLAISCTFSTFGGSMLRPVLTSVITKHAPRSEQGAVLGVTQSLMSLAQVVSPLISGFLIGHEWLAAWSLLAGALCAVGFVFSLLRWEDKTKTA
jgi:MFS transporter, DHA1 family, tetracycline resistance protein